MGQSLVTPGDIAITLHKRCSCCEILSPFTFCYSPSDEFATSSAEVPEVKPFELQVSDDTWSSLRKRVNQEAETIFDPYKVYVASGILCVIIGVFFQVIKPGQEWDNNMVHDDDEFYYDYVENDEDTDDFWQNNDVSANKWKYMYQNKTRLWTLSILITYLIVLVVTLIVSIWMERFNSLADMRIENICSDLGKIFNEQGYLIMYNTRRNMSGIILGNILRERVICCRLMSDAEHGNKIASATYSPPRSSPGNGKDDGSAYGTINVLVPDGFQEGQIINVMTPSGLPIMVAVPSGVNAGKSFKVQIPAQLYNDQKNPAPSSPN